MLQSKKLSSGRLSNSKGNNEKEDLKNKEIVETIIVIVWVVNKNNSSSIVNLSNMFKDTNNKMKITTTITISNEIVTH